MNDFLIAVSMAVGALLVFGAIVGLIKLFGLDATVFDAAPVQQQPADDEWLADYRDAPTVEQPRVVLEADVIGDHAVAVPLTGELFDPLPVADDWDPPLFADLRDSVPMTAITHHALNGRQLELAGAS